MSEQLVLTAINETAIKGTTFSFDSVRSEFEGWLKDAGASQTTIRSYAAAIQKWLKVLALSPGVRPAVVWQRSQLSASTKRVIGYACRRYEMFASEVMGERIDLGIPSRLPASLAASSPTDKAVQFNARKQSSPRAFFCWPIESIKSSILLPCLARGKEESSYGEVTVSADANANTV